VRVEQRRPNRDRCLGHTCHVVGENLLVIGGMQTQKSGGDVQTCANHMPAEIFSLASQNYTGMFDAGAAKRQAPVPNQVVAVIGGTAAGNAYVTAPKVWNDLFLQYVFKPDLARPTYTPTYTLANDTGANSSTPGQSSGPSKEVIIGASVGGAVGGLLLITAVIVAVICCRRQRRRVANSRQSVAHSELPDQSTLQFDDTKSYATSPPPMSYIHPPSELPAPLTEMSSTPSEGSPRFPEWYQGARSISPHSQELDGNERDSRISQRMGSPEPETRWN
jgi:hypothetical protein